MVRRFLILSLVVGLVASKRHLKTAYAQAEGPIPALFVRNETGQVLLVNGRAWREYRAAVAPELQQRDELGNKRSTILEWQSPMMLGDRPLDVGCQVQWLPPSTESTTARTDMDLTAWWIVTALVVGLGLVFSSARRNAAIT